MVRGIAWLLFVPLAIASCRSALWADEESAAASRRRLANVPHGDS